MSDRKALSEKERHIILREAGYRCAVPGCNTILAIDIHHMVEVSKGGGNEPSNLLALCPTHHALYHRGEITQESIKQWKTRIVALNQVVDVSAEIDKKVQESFARRETLQKSGDQRKGFALATSEFYWRTCRTGFVDRYQRFVTTGYCCFVDKKLAITTVEVVDYALEIGGARGGSPRIWTQLGLAPFTIRERFDIGNLAAIEMGEIDDRHVKALLKKYENEEHGKSIASLFSDPLQTPVRSRIAPFLGERVGFLHAPRNSEDYRSFSDVQFDSADVAFNMTLKGKDDFLQYVLTPVPSHIQDRGSPVFTEDGLLVGILRDSIRLTGEPSWRPVVSGALAVQILLQRKK